LIESGFGGSDIVTQSASEQFIAQFAELVVPADFFGDRRGMTAAEEPEAKPRRA